MLTSEQPQDLSPDIYPPSPTDDSVPVDRSDSTDVIPSPHGQVTWRAAWQEWAVALLYLVLDVLAWGALYSLMSYLRSDAYYATPLQLLIVELVQIVVIVQALLIIGGYDRNNEMRNLSYTTEHILALVGAAVVSSLLIYSAATYDNSMKPSRAVLLLSFIVFVPLSLGYRRLIRRFVSASTANRAFLVVGSGELAAEFYREYLKSPNRQRLEFLDLERQRVGEHIAGSESPIIEGDLATKLQNLTERYSGVILAERIDRVGPDLLDRLVRTQFQQTRVYTLESFYEAFWRYVPIQALDPFWPLQMGFQLARVSPYHYLKRLFDVIFAVTALTLCLPVLSLVTALVWIRDGRPIFFRQTRVGREGALFTILKFRTMKLPTVAPEAEDIYTRAGDPRVTGLGRILRKLPI